MDNNINTVFSANSHITSGDPINRSSKIIAITSYVAHLIFNTLASCLSYLGVMGRKIALVTYPFNKPQAQLSELKTLEDYRECLTAYLSESKTFKQEMLQQDFLKEASGTESIDKHKEQILLDLPRQVKVVFQNQLVSKDITLDALSAILGEDGGQLACLLHQGAFSFGFIKVAEIFMNSHLNIHAQRVEGQALDIALSLQEGKIIFECKQVFEVCLIENTGLETLAHIKVITHYESGVLTNSVNKFNV